MLELRRRATYSLLMLIAISAMMSFAQTNTTVRASATASNPLNAYVGSWDGMIQRGAENCSGGDYYLIDSSLEIYPPGDAHVALAELVIHWDYTQCFSNRTWLTEDGWYTIKGNIELAGDEIFFRSTDVSCSGWGHRHYPPFQEFDPCAKSSPSIVHVSDQLLGQIGKPNAGRIMINWGAGLMPKEYHKER